MRKKEKMAKKQKIYAVKKGNQTGIFYTWEECQAATKGFSSPDFKSFATEEEAKAYLDDVDIIYEKQIAPLLSQGKVVAFVDGSFNEEKSTYGFGVHIITPTLSAPIELSGKGTNVEYVNLRNITGEVLGAINAIDWAWKNDFETIVIFHDYEGISKWATGEWNANQPISRFYKSFINDKKEILNIEFVKVAGHSNNKYNDRVDALAKASVNDNKILKDTNGNNGYIINNISKDNIFCIIEELKNECPELNYTVTTTSNKCTYIVTLKNDRVNLSVFNNIKLLVQGKKSNLFQLITTSIIERLDCTDFIKILRDAYGKTINKDELKSSLIKYCPKLKNIVLPQNIGKLLNQAVVDLEAKGYNDIEFSKYTLAALRALEGVIKFNLSKYNIPIPQNGFNMFAKSSGVYVLQQGYKTSVPSQDVIKIENCYNHYFNNRHTLCHFGYVFQGVDTNTRLLNTKSEADSIIRSTLQVINDNYIV